MCNVPGDSSSDETQRIFQPNQRNVGDGREISISLLNRKRRRRGTSFPCGCLLKMATTSSLSLFLVLGTSGFVPPRPTGSPVLFSSKRLATWAPGRRSFVTPTGGKKSTNFYSTMKGLPMRLSMAFGDDDDEDDFAFPEFDGEDEDDDEFSFPLDGSPSGATTGTGTYEDFEDDDDDDLLYDDDEDPAVMEAEADRLLEGESYDDEDFEDDELEYEDEYDYEDDEEDEGPSAELDEEWLQKESDILDLLWRMDKAKQELEELNLEDMVENLTPEEIDILENNEIEAEVEAQAKEFLLTEEEVVAAIEEAKAAAEADPSGENDTVSVLSDFPPRNDPLYYHNVTFLEQGDLVKMEDALREFEKARKKFNSEEFQKSLPALSIMDDVTYLNQLDESDPEQALEKMEILALDEYVDMSEKFIVGGGEEELHKQRKMLIYDRKFDIANIFLASFKVNPDAPVILETWMYQMRNWTRYAWVREQNFNFTWEDVDEANVTELDEYWCGLGTEDGKAPKPTMEENPNIVEWDESPLDVNEEYMLAFETWMEEVYSEEDDICLDDEDFMPDDNEAFRADAKRNKEEIDKAAVKDPTMLDIWDFEEKYGHMTPEWRQTYVEQEDLKVVDRRNDDTFKGMLVIACSQSQEDLDLAEKITLRMRQQFGEAVFVETRVISHARPADNVYEIWLESWEIELLHSKRRAVFQRDWDGPREISDDYLEKLVEKVEFYISDDVRNSFINDFVDVE